MENLKELSDIYRRASLLSIEKSANFSEKKLSIAKKTAEDAPKDTFYLVHLLFLMFGCLNMLPLTFFVTANDYWMYKFRDTHFDIANSNNRTTLQANFASGSGIAQAIPSVISMVVSTVIGHKVKVRSRIILTLTILVGCFTLFTVLIKINTDTWQVGFFALTMGGLAVINSFLPLFQVSTFVLLPKFPDVYMKTFLFGQGMSGIFNSLLQVISLAIGSSTIISALFYFVTGTAMILFTLILFIFSKHLAFYQYHINSNVEDTKRDVYSWKEIKEVFMITWPVILTTLFIMINIIATHPAVTSLVVSENYGKGNEWNDKYFVPVITFLFTEICSFIGRIFARTYITHSSRFYWVIFAMLKFVISVPLIMFCNAKPRKHIPVLLPHDWEYISLIAVQSFTNGYLIMIASISIPRLAVGKEELGLLVMLGCIGIMGCFSTPISLIVVNIL